MSNKTLEFTTRLSREDVAGVIEALVEGLKDGHLKVQKSNEILEMEVPRVVDLEVEAEFSDERAKFEIEVSWRTNRAENPDTPDEKNSLNTGLAAAPKKKSQPRAATGGTKAQGAKRTVKK